MKTIQHWRWYDALVWENKEVCTIFWVGMHLSYENAYRNHGNAFKKLMNMMMKHIVGLLCRIYIWKTHYALKLCHSDFKLCFAHCEMHILYSIMDLNMVFGNNSTFKVIWCTSIRKQRGVYHILGWNALFIWKCI